MTPVSVAVVIGITAITGAIVVIAVAVAPARANADTDADRTRADPNTLRACRHRQCDAHRSQDSDCKLPHGNLLGCCTDGNAWALGVFRQNCDLRHKSVALCGFSATSAICERGFARFHTHILCVRARYHKGERSDSL